MSIRQRIKFSNDKIRFNIASDRGFNATEMLLETAFFTELQGFAIIDRYGFSSLVLMENDVSYIQVP